MPVPRPDGPSKPRVKMRKRPPTRKPAARPASRPRVDTGLIAPTTEERRAQGAQRAAPARRAQERKVAKHDRDGIAGALDDVGRAAEGALRSVYGGPGKKGNPGGVGRAAAAQTRSIGPRNSTIMGVGRTIGHTAGAIGESVARNPIESSEKAGKQAGAIAKGLANAAIALPVYAANYHTKSAIGVKPKGDTPGEIAQRMIGHEGERISRTYGPSYRGEKGSYRKLEKQIEREGPLIPALDLSTVVWPVSAGAGAVLRRTASSRAKRGAAPGAIGKLVNRPDVRVTPLGEAKERAPRSGAVGMVASATRDQLRRTAQRSAEKAAVERRRVRAVRKVTGRDIARTAPGRKANIVNTQPRPLPARRAMLKPGEVTPLTPRNATLARLGGVDRKLRVSTAAPIREGERAADYRIARHVTDTSKRSTSLRAQFKGLPEDLHHAAITAAALGIKDAAAAPAMLQRRIDEIESTVAAARADPRHPDAAAARRDDVHLDELAKLRAYRDSPAVFARADVQRAAVGVRNSPIGPREGLSAERAASGRSALVGGTLGVRTARETNDAARAARKADLKRVLRENRDEGRKIDRGVAAAQRTVVVRERRAAREQGRSTVLTGQADVRLLRADPEYVAAGSQLSRAGREYRNAGKAVGNATRNPALYTPGELAAATARRARAARELREAKAAFATARDAAQARLARTMGTAPKRPLARLEGAQAAVQQARIARDAAVRDAAAGRAAARQRAKQARVPIVRTKESAAAYEQRVIADAASKGLAPPAHVRGDFKRDDEGVLPVARSENASPANPVGAQRKGTLYRTGREDKTLANIEETWSRSLRRGARLEARSKVIAEHGKSFKSEKAASEWAAAHGLRLGPDSDMIAVPVSQLGGMAAKGLVNPRTTKHGKPTAKSDAGAYVKSDDVIILPRTVHRELLDLDAFARRPPSPVKRALAGSQAALLALNPAWWQFQRVNDLVAATMGGSAMSTVKLERMRRELRRSDPDAAEVLSIVSGGSMSREMLTPHSAQKLGRIKQILDANPTFRDALRSDKPATALLLRGGHDAATSLLRSDAAITGSFRERQMLHNLRKTARKMDPHVAAINSAFDPIGVAFANGDLRMIARLLKDPKYQAQLADAATRLNKVHGDWHHYTARELSSKQYAAFYGFLRYSTRMALFTLPLDHPALGLLVARLGQMGAQDAKAIVGPDMPWGLGTLYNSDGTIAADFARANPLTGPLLSIEKPEQIVSLATPLAGLLISYIAAQPLGLSDSSTGYAAQYDVRGDPKDHALGGRFSEERGRIMLGQALRFLGPLSEWQRFEQRLQTDDTLPWNRRIQSEAPGSEAQARLDAKNANRVGGLEGLAHNTLPLLFPGSDLNRKVQGESITSARKAAREKERKRKVRRAGGSTSTGTATGGWDLTDPGTSTSSSWDLVAPSSSSGTFP